MTRNRLVTGALGLVVGAGALGWIAGAAITSPAEAAARAQAPQATLITVAVDQRVLSADIIARGSIDYDDPVSLSLSGATGDPEARQIITYIPAEGTDLPEGSVALEVAGRPVILLQGEISTYRDMRPGSSGVDILQLEQALVRLGYMTKADSVWDKNTGAGVQALYAAVGYSANSVSDSETASLRAARDAVRSANQYLADAEAAIANAGAVSASSLLEAQAAVADAQDALTIAQAARTAANTAANGDLAVKQAELLIAQAAFAPGSPEVVAAQAGVDDATNSVATVAAEQDAAAAAAQRSLDIANARLTELQAPGDLTPLERARDAAKRDLQAANQALVALEASVGTWMASGELIFLERMPVQVARLNAQRGDTVSGPFMTVSGADIAMTVGLQEGDAKRLEVGDTVIIDEPDLLPTPIEAVIGEIPEAGPSGRVQVVVVLDTIPPELMGANVRVIIPVESTAGEVLVVPAAALSAVANGDTRVEVEDPDNPGTTRFVTVVTGLATDGVVEVRPVDGSLAKGDRVVVGQADIGPAGSDDPAPEPEASDDAASG